ncbi:MAG TPA: hypothetical protein DCO75_11615 [Fibrobacteres bacterium]|nr:hypothetical protein [Fibrobacterota bacterium]
MYNRQIIKTAAFFVFCIGSFQAIAVERDTIIISDGGPGPYMLGRNFVDTSSIHVDYADTTDNQLPQYILIGNAGAILFSRPIDSGARLKVRFRTVRYGLPRTYSLFEKAYMSPRDTFSGVFDTATNRKGNVFAEENLTLSGYKSVGVSVNNLGSINLEQALDVTLSGDIAPHTSLSGHLSDQGSSLEGSTREVSDLDMIYVSLDNPHYNAIVGDQYEQWPVTGMLSGKKKIKGIGAGLSLPGISVKAFGALSSGKSAVQTIAGKAGLQGPYRLTGEGEEGFIMPLQGTVRITVSGNKLTEGTDQDYTVDYDVGTITFTSRKLVKNDDIIRVEYEYRLFNYQRIFSGASVSSSTPDSALTINGGLWYETDDKNHPQDLTLSAEDKTGLAAAGDSTDIYYKGRLIDSKDVAWESAQEPLYRLDSSGNFGFSPFDPENPTDNQGFYYVTFKEVDAGEGNYIADSAKMIKYPALGTIYKYVGTGKGNATLPQIPLPEATVNGEVLVKAASRWASAKIDVAGTSRDRNLFSNLEDNDNNGAAIDASAILGAKKTDRKSIWLGASYTHITPSMTQDVSSAFDRNNLWDDTTATTKTGLRQSWETSGGAALRTDTYTEAAYGQYLQYGRLITDRISGSAKINPLKNLSLDYNGGYFRHHAETGINTTRRDNGRCTYNSPLGEVSLEYKDEWRNIITGNNQGMVCAGVNLKVTPLSLKESFLYSQYRSGNGGLFNARDTGFSVLWENELSRSFTPFWRTDLTSHYYLQNIFNHNKTSTLLVTAMNDLSFPQKGLSTKQNYQVTIEQAATYAQVPVYVGTGLGDHVWDATDSEYVPSKNGDYIIQEQEVYGDASDDRVRKAQFSATWSLNRSKKKIRGILADLSWTGALNIDEQLDPGRNIGTISWLPGYTSLFNKRSLKDSLVSYSDISYRQNIDWNPEKFKGYHGDLSIQPFYKKIRSYSETGLDLSPGCDRTLRHLTLGIDGNVLSANRKSLVSTSSDTYRVNDRHAMLTERYNFYRAFSSSLKESAGWASKVSDSYDNNGWYYRVAPGLSWQPAQRGSAEITYTYSSVNIPGTLDYRMAQGFSAGVSHVIELSAQINFGTHFTADISSRSQFGGVSSKSGLHTVSMQMKAFL